MLKCENCCYYAVTDITEWNGKEHCCFSEWGHGDWETAPCDEPEWDDDEIGSWEENEEYYEEDYEITAADLHDYMYGI